MTIRPGSMTSRTKQNVGMLCVVPQIHSSPSVLPDAEVNARGFDDGGDFREHGRRERQRPLDEHGMFVVLGRKKGHRDLRHVAFLAPKARPERRVDHLLDDFGTRQRRDRVVPAQTSGAEMLREMFVRFRGDDASGRIRFLGQCTFLRFWVLGARFWVLVLGSGFGILGSVLPLLVLGSS